MEPRNPVGRGLRPPPDPEKGDQRRGVLSAKRPRSGGWVAVAVAFGLSACGRVGGLAFDEVALDGGADAKIDDRDGGAARRGDDDAGVNGDVDGEAVGGCVSSIDCDDGNLCTADSCDPISGCVNDGTGIIRACDDRNECTTGDVCVGDAAGTCAGTDTSLTDCDDGNVCTVDSCDPRIGCENDGTGVTSSCDDADPCTIADSCAGDAAGTCVGADVDCDDGDACTDDICDDAGACTNPPAAPGTPCGDAGSSGCTLADSCDGAGLCLVNDLTDGSACTDCSTGTCSGCLTGSCRDVSYRVFVTSTTTNGAFGGVADGDAICSQLAGLQNLGGRWIAWLSDTTGGPSTRVFQSPVPYVLLDGTRIADDWADLTDGLLLAPIDLAEDGTRLVGEQVWTGTQSDGTPDPISHNTMCDDWTQIQFTPWSATVGETSQTDDRWSDVGSYFAACSLQKHLYCFEQP